MSIRESHKEFSKRSSLFQQCCKLADIPATKRQAAKFRDGRGKARAFIAEAKKIIGQNAE